MTAPALVMREVTAGYGGVAAIRDVDITVEAGRVLALLGPNGAGKSTTLLSIVGAVKVMAGTIESFGSPLRGRRIEQVARLGIGLVPDNRGVFHQLTVGEHLRLARGSSKTKSVVDQTLARFPGCRSSCTVAAGSCPAANSRCWHWPRP
ncbi:MAG: ATP-binding cassette domain-containing protein [Ilumatobacteraceae bacterium]